jgi:hypothetical protein
MLCLPQHYSCTGASHIANGPRQIFAMCKERRRNTPTKQAFIIKEAGAYLARQQNGFFVK